MFRYERYHLQGNKMSYLKDSCLWQSVIYKVLRSVAALLLTLSIKNKLQVFLRLTVVAASFVFIFCWFLLFTLIFKYNFIIIRHEFCLDTPVQAYTAESLSSSLLSKNLKIKIQRTIILSVVLYGCVTWWLTLREERRLRVFENRAWRRTFWPKRVR